MSDPTAAIPPRESEHINRLRQQYPHVSPGFFDLMEERRQVQDRLNDLQGRLTYLIGYHSGRGAVPVAELQRVLDGEQVVSL
ncbi:MAG TPA: hypothetical protein VJT49_10605 [Amycolatopsis sp.]|uniref:hypothetical protein n=1 Tax=Amycolatopsis sp. TaxID=37632 RepID=UPI002B45A145|nr:hypothetical protein [Amycolatopsis sp.]HKS45545.1 hypothetical protein [Amycolatopsis sp.]